jgi:hypothetical protein
MRSIHFVHFTFPPDHLENNYDNPRPFYLKIMTTIAGLSIVEITSPLQVKNIITGDKKRRIPDRNIISKENKIPVHKIFDFFVYIKTYNVLENNIDKYFNSNFIDKLIFFLNY